MTDATLFEIMAALADQIRDTLTPVVGDMQVEGYMLANPSPPSIDIYPGDPSGEQIAYDYTSQELLLTVRVRVSSADSLAGQELLLSMIDPRNPNSIGAAIAANKTLDGTVGAVLPLGASGYTRWPDPGGEGELLGAQLQVRVLL